MLNVLFYPAVGVAILMNPCAALLRGFESPPVVPSQGDPHNDAMRERCASLTNKGTHSEIEIAVGTPGQVFSVVADTGSNSVIVPSCVCKQQGHCEEKSRCFTGTNKSSTFLLDKTGGEHGLLEEVITFGSGPLSAVSATDVVNVSGLHKKLSGLLLMTENDFYPPMPGFEGILGLGTPKSIMQEEEGQARSDRVQNSTSSAARDANEESAIREILKHVLSGDGDIISNAATTPTQMWRRDAVLKHSPSPKRPSPKKPEKLEVHPRQQPGFLEQADVQHFSMCFNENSDGVLRFGAAPEHHHDNALNSVGKAHWGLGMTGISVGDNTTFLADICREKKAGQDTACGAIPDSGTTVMMAPRKHLLSLFDSICDRWDRCKSNHTAYQLAAKKASSAAADVYGFDPFGIDTGVSKSFIFQFLMLDCESWMDMSKESHGLNELPELFFHLGSNEGESLKLSMDGWSYILEETNKPPADDFKKGVRGIGLPPGDSALQYFEKDRAMLERARTLYGRFLGDTGENEGTKHVYAVPASAIPEAMGAADSVRGDSSMKLPDGMKLPESIQRLASRSKVCRPAFGEMDYPTQKNGPVWVLGTPVFFAYKVGYGLKTEPPTISFTSVKDSPCGACGHSKEGASLASDVIKPRRPRRVDGPWRDPSFVQTAWRRQTLVQTAL